MLERLNSQETDGIIAIMQKFQEDTRPGKIDLGIGVYRNEQGVTPIFSAVKKASLFLAKAQTTMAYTAMSGEKDYLNLLAEIVFGGSVEERNIASVATVGGSGAIHHAAEIISRANPTATVWLPTPSWSNHSAIFAHVGLETKAYRYFCHETKGIDFEGLKSDLFKAQSDDVILLHGCCHNPTGADLNQDQWLAVTGILEKTRAVPMIDLAYQGFGDGLEADSYGVRLMVSTLPECFVATTNSKNFSIYRERTGALFLTTENAETKQNALSNLVSLNRLNFSFPPDHGARLVTTVLADPDLKREWQQELEAARIRLVTLRDSLADTLKKEIRSDRFDFIRYHKGMFSYLGLTEKTVSDLKDQFGVYMLPDSRINIAGMKKDQIPSLAHAISTVIS